MRAAIEAARASVSKGAGGPFGACIVRDGQVLAVSSNHVLAHHDPTAHAEVSRDSAGVRWPRNAFIGGRRMLHHDRAVSDVFRLAQLGARRQNRLWHEHRRRGTHWALTR